MAGDWDVVDQAPLDNQQQPRSAGGDWDVVSQEPQPRSAGGDWDVVSQEPRRFDQAHEHPEGAEPPGDQPSTLGTAARDVLRSVIPTTAGIIGGLGSAAAAAPTAPFTAGVGPVAAGFVGGAAAAYGTRQLQNKITDTLGIDSPESRERDVTAHPYVSTAAELVPAAATLQFGTVGKNLSERLAERLASGAALGAVDVVNQGISKGSISDIDPTQTAISVAAGAAMPNLRPWARGLFPEKTFGPTQTTAKAASEPEVLSPAGSGVTRYNTPNENPEIQAVFKAKAAPSPGIDATEGPARSAENQAFVDRGRNLERDFPTRQAEPAGARELFTPGEQGEAANENTPWRMGDSLSSETRQPDMGGAGDPSVVQRYGERTRLRIPERLQQWRENNPTTLEGERARMSQTDPRLTGVREAAVPETVAPPERPPGPPAPAPAGPLAILDDLSIPPFLRRVPVREVSAEIPPAGAQELPSRNSESENFGGRGVVGQSENIRSASPAENAEIGAMRTEPTEAGQQGVLPGAERISDAELAQRRASQPLRANADQQQANEGLFGETAPQGEMFKTPRLRKSAPKPFQGMIENQEQYKQNAKDRTESGLGTQRLTTTAEEEARQGRTVAQANAEYNQHGEIFDSALRQAGVEKDAVGSEVRDLAIRRMLRGEEPLEALDNASVDVERSARREEETQPHSLSAAAPEGGASSTYKGGATAPKGEQLKWAGGYQGAIKAVGNALGKVFKTRELIAPETLSKDSEAMDKVIRAEQGGLHAQGVSDVQQIRESLDKLSGHIQKIEPDARNEALDNYERGAVPKTNPLHAWSNTMRKIAQRQENALHKVSAEDEYGSALSGMFERPTDAQQFQHDNPRDFIDQFRADQGRNPTIGEIRQQGFQLKDEFLDADKSPNLQTIVNHQNFLRGKILEKNRVIEEGRNMQMPDGRFLLSQSDAPGLEPIDTRITKGVQLYADRGTRLVLERYFNPFTRDPAVKNALDAAMYLKNATNSWNLALDTYHMNFMLGESVGASVARGFGRLTSDPQAGLRDIMTAVASPYTLAKSGQTNVLEALKHPDQIKDQNVKDIVGYMTKAGYVPMRVHGTEVTPELETGFMANYVNAFKPAFEQYKHDLVQRGLKGKNAAETGDYSLAAKHGALGAVEALSRGMQLLMHPFFNVYIPMLKGGAIFENMAAYTRDHPGLGEAHYVDMAKRFIKTADNAMGELNQSTLYWPPLLKYAGNVATVSLGWNVGNWRQVGSATGSLLKNPKSAFTSSQDFNPAIPSLVAGAMVTALGNVIYQFMKTGEMPKNVTDVIAPRTGGKAARSNMPERAIMPGYEKDYLEASHIIGGPEPMAKSTLHMAYNKLASLWRTGLDLANNSDWSGHVIANQNDPFTSRMKDYLAYVGKNVLEPIGVQNLTRGGVNPNSNISAIERGIGIRHAPAQWEKPQQYLAGVEKQQKKEAEEATRFHKRIGF